MNWFFLTLMAIVIWSLVNLLDKFIVTKQLRNPLLDTVVFCLVQFSLFIVFGVIFSSELLNPLIVWPAMLAGFLYIGATYFYYSAINKENVSVLATVLAVEPLVIALGGLFFLKENLSFINYLGTVFIVAGALAISYERRFHWSRYLGFSFLAMILFAIRNILIKYNDLAGVNFSEMAFAFGLGGLLLMFPLIIISAPQFEKKHRLGLRNLAVVSVLSALGLLAYLKAITLGELSLVASFLATKPLFVLLLVIILSRYYPKFIKEKISRDQLLKKLLAMGLIIVGTGGILF